MEKLNRKELEYIIRESAKKIVKEYDNHMLFNTNGIYDPAGSSNGNEVKNERKCDSIIAYGKFDICKALAKMNMQCEGMSGEMEFKAKITLETERFYELSYYGKDEDGMADFDTEDVGFDCCAIIDALRLNYATMPVNDAKMRLALENGTKEALKADIEANSPNKKEYDDTMMFLKSGNYELDTDFFPENPETNPFMNESKLKAMIKKSIKHTLKEYISDKGE